MKAELKNLAKDTFLEELERLRVNNSSAHPAASDRHPYLEQEVQRLQHVVNDIRRQQHHSPYTPATAGVTGMFFPPMNLEWSNPIVRDQMNGRVTAATHLNGNNDLRSYDPHDLPFEDSLFQASSLGGNGNDYSPRNQHFVLSSAPIHGFEDLMKQETSLFRDAMQFTKGGNGNAGNSTINNTMSVVEQANRYAEIQSLFQMPSSLGNFGSIDGEYSLSQYLMVNTPAEIQRLQQEKERRQQQSQQTKNNLERAITSHKERLDKSRNPIRRFPLSVPSSRPSQSGKSPRVTAHNQRSIVTAPEFDSEKSQEILPPSPTGGYSNQQEEGDNRRIVSPSRLAQSAPNQTSFVTSTTPFIEERSNSRSHSPLFPSTAISPSSGSLRSRPLVLTDEEFRNKTDR
jgi:hypothetical protein